MNKEIHITIEERRDGLVMMLDGLGSLLQFIKGRLSHLKEFCLLETLALGLTFLALVRVYELLHALLRGLQ